MEKWFSDFLAEQAAKRPWLVKYVAEDNTIHEDQLAGENAQAVANYVRKVNGPATMIYFIAKLDNTCN